MSRSKVSRKNKNKNKNKSRNSTSALHDVAAEPVSPHLFSGSDIFQAHGTFNRPVEIDVPVVTPSYMDAPEARLPVELLYAVASVADRSVLLTLCCVSKAFNHIAAASLYKFLLFKSPSTAVKCLRTLCKRPGYGRCVQYFTLDFSRETRRHLSSGFHSLFKRALKNLPSIHHMSIFDIPGIYLRGAPFRLCELRFGGVWDRDVVVWLEEQTGLKRVSFLATTPSDGVLSQTALPLLHTVQVDSWLAPQLIPGRSAQVILIVGELNSVKSRQRFESALWCLANARTPTEWLAVTVTSHDFATWADMAEALTPVRKALPDVISLNIVVVQGPDLNKIFFDAFTDYVGGFKRLRHLAFDDLLMNITAIPDKRQIPTFLRELERRCATLRTVRLPPNFQLHARMRPAEWVNPYVVRDLYRANQRAYEGGLLRMQLYLEKIKRNLPLIGVPLDGLFLGYPIHKGLLPLYEEAGPRRISLAELEELTKDLGPSMGRCASLAKEQYFVPPAIEDDTKDYEVLTASVKTAQFFLKNFSVEYDGP
ncbi:uncharacterized protein BXZ73DRAFT_99352 [Epithele typhae]|uniref:uncharacterized protein n=1 Tax=Epithele typhae TaxID=378194 RepID=UPI002007323B|nr:uncharacterized protein BXZ73DRAFT_99352 [Epithele typhae]KAH9939720.1 hypothetical protein BXZ73DRAFT_99352 [Epithele typhae]